ncbi:hypothetical protein FSP39_020659 [Pinctada imbricata]|uniref:DDB1-and CUL4-associated factor 5 n=1 Tax=Pinctada imbricata TaxID=66713 RepID=A0AA88Y6H3_PINIB|nr:hypothetical protein FSP39_020659 [Pinctada imbricata]
MADAKNLFSRDLKAHFGCVNAIEFSSNGGELIASGGDDHRVLIWNAEKALSDIGTPVPMKGEHNSNIFCIAFDNHNKKIYSGGNDEQVIVHDLTTGETMDVFMHDDAVYGLSVDPSNDNVFASACDDGRILIYDIRLPPQSADAFVLANYTSSMHAVMYNPVEPRLLATANAKEGLALWDVRKPRSCILRYGGGYTQQSCMSVRISRSGNQLIALRRRLPPVLYNIHSSPAVCEFDHDGYFNSCTMKSCSFAGDKDQYVLSGSDNFNLYVWKIPDDLSEYRCNKEPHMILRGHRSIVNQVRFNPANHIIISSGVEKIIKVWSPFPMMSGREGIDNGFVTNNDEREIYTHEEYINLVLRTGHVMNHDYSSQSVEEDPRMIAFFDSLVQRELEGNSSEDLSSSEEEMYERMVQLSRSDVSEDSSSDEDVNLAGQGHESEANEDDIDDPAVSPFTIAFASVMAAQASERSEALATGRNDTDQQSASRTENSEETQETESATSERRSELLNSDFWTTRRSISDLIAQKRKEMQKQSVEHKRNKLRRKRKLLSSSSDSSDEDDNVRKNIEEKLKSGKDDDLGHPENVKSAQKQRSQLQLKRLKQLRENVMNSDSDNSNPDSVENSDRLNPMSNSKKENDQESNSKCKDGSEALSSLHDKKIFSQEGACLIPNLESQGSKESWELKGEGSSQRRPVNGCGNTEQDIASTSSETQTAENSQPHWSEFKRFKNRNSKSKRQYRSRSQEED